MKNKVNVQEVRSGLHDRRSFLRISGLALAGTGLLIAGCSDDDDGGMNNTVPGPGVINGTFDLGGGDLGILTYAYALEQLEAEFYNRVVNNASFGSTFSPDERAILEDLYDHEVIHREFFKAALTGAVSNPQTMLLPDLDFTFPGVNFSNRLSVLQTAKVLEDTGVAAYNGAGKYISDANYLLLAGKIVSVEARHASAIRDLLNPGSTDFAGDDVVDANGLDEALKPSLIVPMVDPFITTAFTANYLP
ncbi:ferritin-like domain-containing protein [Flavobacterium sp. J372]|uniref:ferritin-like domain-containing protein n=1 Tax=Flavobacterium sp. J372 TaxID=2898436 RepID=UPI0021518519|nr:ferritin-like domain-containing protein [Flavobacterium sp. J372]MCR5860737.1 ferritin-like domain-containing protein [Flavobacterium sp. J372]